MCLCALFVHARHRVANKVRKVAVTCMLWAGLHINGESPGQHEMTGLVCKVRSSDTA